MGEISSSEFDLRFQELLLQMIASFSTALVRVDPNSQGKDQAALLGSGTFVQLNGVSGILTAAHVAERLHSPFMLGLSLASHHHHYLIESDRLVVTIIGKGMTDANGPDLAFIALPHTHVADVSATRIFYNVLQHRADFSVNLPHDYGPWFLYGFPAALCAEVDPAPGYKFGQCLTGLAGHTIIHRYYEADGFDYFEVPAKPNESEGIPESLGGMSGGGLWQVLVGRNAEGRVIPGKCLFSGVAFYQEPRSDSTYLVRCHGWRSIYFRALESVP